MDSLRRWWDTTFAIEVLLLVLAAPFLYFAGRFGEAGVIFAVGLLAAGWLWRRIRLGYWLQRTPADWPIFFLFFVMLPIAVWAAPQPLRVQYSWPKVYVLIWNFCLFWTIVTHAGRKRELKNLALVGFTGVGLLMALVAPLGTNWLYKLPGLHLLLERFPSVLGHLSREGQSGFHPNTIAGGLLYVLPLLVALTVTFFHQDRRQRLFWLTLFSTLYMGGIFGLLQSRGGYIGLAVAMVAMLLVNFWWGRRLLLAGLLLGAAALPFASSGWLELVSDTPIAATVGGTSTLEGFRMQLWAAALMAINDFAFTGVGFAAFQEVALLLYPLTIPPTYYFGHAHNFWLQGAVDFGIPGLVAILAIYMAVVVQWVVLWKDVRSPLERGVAVGFMGSLIAQSIFSLTDAIAMGSTPNLLFWYLFALILATANLRRQADQPAMETMSPR
jgi:O-antigen ligase